MSKSYEYFLIDIFYLEENKDPFSSRVSLYKILDGKKNKTIKRSSHFGQRGPLYQNTASPANIILPGRDGELVTELDQHDKRRQTNGKK